MVNETKDKNKLFKALGKLTFMEVLSLFTFGVLIVLGVRFSPVPTLASIGLFLSAMGIYNTFFR